MGSIQTPVSTLSLDPWLSKLMDRDVFRLVPGVDLLDSVPPGLASLSGPRGRGAFIYTKVDTASIPLVHALENIGFRLIDTNLTFRKARRQEPFRSLSIGTIRWAEESDENAAVRIAAGNIAYSRFHLDPGISDELAGFIKGEWVRNYFRGGRGERMALAEVGGKLAGFLQIIFAGDHFVIDLIAVDRAFRKRGFAQAMIGFAESELPEFSDVVVGTQAANIPSIRMYEKLGFRAVASAYVMHRHRKAEAS